MPELPEVQTTVSGINKHLPGKKIISVWNDYKSNYFKGKENIKDPSYFKKFEKEVVGEKIKKAERRGKNIIIHLTNDKAILIHMKMTGHLLYGKYKKVENSWIPHESGPLTDPFNRHIRLVFALDNGKALALCDMRKFAKVLFTKENPHKHKDLEVIAKDPFEMSRKEFVDSLRKKKSGRIMNILMDQNIVSGIGNIYSDEILWKLEIHPEESVSNLSDGELRKIWKEARIILKKGIHFGGDSTSDYRNIKGEPGNFQQEHRAYRKTGEKCPKKWCPGKIIRKVVGGRSAHFCSSHQKLKIVKSKKLR